MLKFSGISGFDYKDVRLLPAKNNLSSRGLADTSILLGDRKFKIPVVPANMTTVIDTKLAKWLARNDYFYIMHRFNNDPVELTKDFHSEGLYASISLGIQDKDFHSLEELAKLEKSPEFITIDVAHGHSQKVIEIVSAVSAKLPKTFIIAGNVATAEAAIELEEAGANAVKVGVGPGAACTTSPNTGFGTNGWQLSAVQEVSKSVKNALVIADGGIREYGDIAKSIAFGADLVMIGGMFAGHEESPGEVLIKENGEKYKVFFGSASEHQKGVKKYVEGKMLEIPYRGNINETLTTIQENLQSSISYSGGASLDALRSVEYVLLR